ncbi:MAG: hypothetical protein CYG61_04710 [Actinobacteria bacterium]|nr:MAG: hypothetical protein CYG61_04710 [Actinomycetota bacterium]
MASGFFAVQSLGVSSGNSAPPPQKPAPQEAYGNLPLSFEANHGQTDPQVKFLTRGANGTLFLTADQAVLSLTKRGRDLPSGEKAPAQDAVVRMKVVGANPDPQVSGGRALPGKVNHLIGSDPAKWQTNVPTYREVRYNGVYPGVDLLYYGKQGSLEYDFIVAPGADPSVIRLDFDGAQGMGIDKRGDLVVQTVAGEVRHHKPVLYQRVGDKKEPVTGRFVLKGTEVRFAVGDYDPTLPLVIDPILSYSTWLGGGGADVGFGLAVAPDGSAFVAGETASTNFPTKGSVSCGTTTSSYQCDQGRNDAFVAKLNPTGSALVYATYLGGSKEDLAHRLALDADGNAYLAGGTNSADDPGTTAVEAGFPTTANAFDGTCGTDGYCNAFLYDPANCTVTGGCPTTAQWDIFLAKLNAAGDSLLYSTFLGGSGEDHNVPGTALPGHLGVAVSGTRAYIGANTGSSDYPVTAGAAQSTCGTAAIAGCDNHHLDAVVTVLDTAQSGAGSLVYSTYLGGSGNEDVKSIAVDRRGDAFVTGITTGYDDGAGGRTNNFPTTASALQPTYKGGVSDAFVARLDPTTSGPSSLVYSTYLGGGGTDQGWGVAVHNSQALVTGFTDSGDDPATPAADGPAPYFPTTALAYDTTFNGRATTTPSEAGKGCTVQNGCTIFLNGDAFVTRLLPEGTGLVYSTFLGGSDGDTGGAISVDLAGTVYVTGYTTCQNDNGGVKLPAGATPPPPCHGSFPTQNPIQADMDGSYIGHELHNSPTDVFVTKLAPGGNSLLFSTYLGGRDFDRGFALAVRDRDEQGNPIIPEMYVTGRMASGARADGTGAYPTTPGSFRPTKPSGNGNRDVAVSKIVGL